MGRFRTVPIGKPHQSPFGVEAEQRLTRSASQQLPCLPKPQRADSLFQHSMSTMAAQQVVLAAKASIIARSALSRPA
jgi:hypothetical protein